MKHLRVFYTIQILSVSLLVCFGIGACRTTKNSLSGIQLTDDAYLKSKKENKTLSLIQGKDSTIKDLPLFTTNLSNRVVTMRNKNIPALADLFSGIDGVKVPVVSLEEEHHEKYDELFIIAMQTVATDVANLTKDAAESAALSYLNKRSSTLKLELEARKARRVIADKEISEFIAVLSTGFKFKYADHISIDGLMGEDLVQIFENLPEIEMKPSDSNKIPEEIRLNIKLDEKTYFGEKQRYLSFYGVNDLYTNVSVAAFSGGYTVEDYASDDLPAGKDEIQDITDGRLQAIVNAGLVQYLGSTSESIACALVVKIVDASFDEIKQNSIEIDFKQIYHKDSSFWMAGISGNGTSAERIWRLFCLNNGRTEGILTMHDIRTVFGKYLISNMPPK